MKKVIKQAFPNAATVTNRFHIAKLVSEAVQEIRIKTELTDDNSVF